MTANPNMFQHPGLDDSQGGQPDQEERLYAGKYKSVEELEKGYLNMQTVENQNNQRLAAIEARLGASDPDDRILPSERREGRKRPEEVLEEMGIPSEAIGDLVLERITQALNPIIQGNQAREQLRHSYQNFDSLEGEVANFIASTPDVQTRYQRMFRVDQGAAMEWAIDRYLKTKGPGTAPAESASGADAAAARLDARLPGSGSPANRGQDLGQAQRLEQLQKAYEYAQKTGDWSVYSSMRINEVIPESHMLKQPGTL
jgi:hypothetical protein